MNNGDMPAAPQHGRHGQHEGFDILTTSMDYGSTGLTKREHFAAIAMQGLLAGGLDVRYIDGLTEEQIKNNDWCCEDHVCFAAVSYANALLKALEEAK